MYCTYLQCSLIAVHVCMVIIGIGIDRDLSPLMRSSSRVRSVQGHMLSGLYRFAVFCTVCTLAVHLLFPRLKIKESPKEMCVGIPCQVTALSNAVSNAVVSLLFSLRGHNAK